MEEKYTFIKEECLNATTKDPIEILFSLMQKDYISIHGPEHHILDGACFLTAIHNFVAEKATETSSIADSEKIVGSDKTESSIEMFDLEKALDEMIERGKKMPGATCGQWGVCGSSASIGAALAIIHGTGPLSDNQYYKDNLTYASQALGRIAEVGGPRCCKRNAFLSMQTAIDFVREHYGIELPVRRIACIFSSKNQQCIGRNCPYFGGEIDE